jgi:class 3 adenylate cyclase
MTTTAGVHRKLAAILCADVEGYSRLIADDPEATIETLSRYRSVFAECSQCLDGRVVDSPGDGIYISVRLQALIEGGASSSEEER